MPGQARLLEAAHQQLSLVHVRQGAPWESLARRRNSSEEVAYTHRSYRHPVLRALLHITKNVGGHTINQWRRSMDGCACAP